ncbi:hypothetical protein ASF09_03340 [Sphingomonas sp. Leaf242]|nr:hypothetical protein ASF09_03340 [Sphingomonas sp. Leaf242]
MRNSSLTLLMRALYLPGVHLQGYVGDMDELTTSIVGIDFPNEDKSKSNRRMECMLCAPGDVVELRLEPKNPFDANAVAIFSDRGTQLGYVSAERAPLIGKRIKED